jgi:hypothetical protein
VSILEIKSYKELMFRGNQVKNVKNGRKIKIEMVVVSFVKLRKIWVPERILEVRCSGWSRASRFGHFEFDQEET